MKKQMINTIIEKIKSDYKEDIALLVRYDIQDLPSKGLNLYFIPKTERAYELSTQYIMNGTGYDLFPMRWERLISVASMDSPQAYLFKEAEIVYVGDAEALERFNRLKQGLEQVLDGEYGEALLNKAFEYLNETYIYLFNLEHQCKDLMDYRMEASKLLKQVSNVIAFVNQDYFRGGNGTSVSILEASMKMNKLPQDYKQHIDSIIAASEGKDIIDHCLTLITAVRELLETERASGGETVSFQQLFKGYYEELTKYLNQFEAAIDNGNSYKQYEIASYIHEEVSQFMTKVNEGIWFDDRSIHHTYAKAFQEKFDVDFMALIAQQDAKALKEGYQGFIHNFEQLLKEENVNLLRFDDIKGFAAYFKNM